MLESGYQSKIIKDIINIGGTAITGKLKTGEADIQAGYPIEVFKRYSKADEHGAYTAYEPYSVLVKLAVEVKTPKAYEYLMKGVKEVDGLYVIHDDTKLKEHEHLQITKLNNVRKRGGFAIVAHSFQQVKEYMDGKV